MSCLVFQAPGQSQERKSLVPHFLGANARDQVLPLSYKPCHGPPEHDTAVYPFPRRKNTMSSPLEYPPELLSLICAYVYVASIPSRVSSLILCASWKPEYRRGYPRRIPLLTGRNPLLGRLS